MKFVDTNPSPIPSDKIVMTITKMDSSDITMKTRKKIYLLSPTCRVASKPIKVPVYPHRLGVEVTVFTLPAKRLLDDCDKICSALYPHAFKGPLTPGVR